ncbi:phosphoglycerate mutase [Chloroflexus islandicus]|uniref:Phosphoglycerate mutase n=1 Tax=Chloroflexus islandicus TaxID=1707952 RepID=A0A178MI16_9CHLR|nr:histidine phosphatase family protein [Chloroflexus islandicus]OAN47654.1 phosphoglycerate mutase [Chloroflexus islandicus]
MRTSIWFVRHGQTEANRARRYLGRGDSPLTEYGLRQHAAAANRLRPLPFTHAIASPTQRTRALAETLLQHRSIPLREDPRWIEVDQGLWEGLTYREVTRRFPSDAQARWALGVDGRPTGGESLAEAAARVAAAWQELLATYRGGRILVATHATPIQLVLCLCCNTPIADHWRWRIDLGSITALDVYGASIIIRTVNTVPPLGG